MTLGKKIKLFRKEKGYSQQKLADLTGLARITIAQYETNKYQPSEQNLNKISSVLSVPILCFSNIDELYKDEANRNYILSLPINERLQILRLSVGKTREELASTIFYDFGQDISGINDLSELTIMLQNFESNTNLELSDEMIAVIASALNVPDGFLRNKKQRFKLIEKNIELQDKKRKKEHHDMLCKFSELSGVSLDVIKEYEIFEGYHKYCELFDFDNFEKEHDDEFYLSLNHSESTVNILQAYNKLATILHDYTKFNYEFVLSVQRLNSKGMQKLTDYSQDLLKIEEYTTPDPDPDEE